MKRFLEILSAVAMALLVLIMFACGPSQEQRAKELTDAAAEVCAAVQQTYSTVAIEAEYPNVKLNVALDDSLFHAELLTEPVANFFLAKYIQQLPANNGKQLLAKVKEAQGAVLLTVTDLYGQTFTAEMTPEHVTGLFTAKNTQLSVPAVKEGLETLLGSQLQIPARFKLAGEVSGSFEGNFFEYTVPVKAVDVANLTQGNIVFYHQQLLKNQWKNLATFASLIKELGIDGIRVVYADVDSDKKVKQAFPWRSIFEE